MLRLAPVQGPGKSLFPGLEGPGYFDGDNLSVLVTEMEASAAGCANDLGGNIPLPGQIDQFVFVLRQAGNKDSRLGFSEEQGV